MKSECVLYYYEECGEDYDDDKEKGELEKISSVLPDGITGINLYIH